MVEKENVRERSENTRGGGGMGDLRGVPENFLHRKGVGGGGS